MIIESIAKYLTGRRHIRSVTQVGANLEITFDNKTQFVGLHVCAVYPKTVDYTVYWGYPTHARRQRLVRLPQRPAHRRAIGRVLSTRHASGAY